MKKLWRFTKYLFMEMLPLLFAIAVFGTIGGSAWVVVHFDLIGWFVIAVAVAILLAGLASIWNDFDKKDQE